MKLALLPVVLLSLFLQVQASELFVEAESFASKGGWTVVTGAPARTASGLGTLSGASGATNGTATARVTVKDPGRYRIWVRYMSPPQRRGPFHVTALAGDRELGDGLFDTDFEGKSARYPETWDFFEADLPEGDITLRLTKHENRNSSGPSRQVDCLILTMDEKLVPNHLYYGAPTYLRVTIGDTGAGDPLYIHIFADHFHGPWYQHFSIGRSGGVPSIHVRKQDMLKAGETTGWCNIAPLLYQDSGAMLHITARHAYTNYAARLRAKFEFATAPAETSVVRTLDIDNIPAGFAVFVPPNLLTKTNLALLKTDREIAEDTGRLADAHPWPTHGKKPQLFPFFVTEAIQSTATPRSDAVVARERKTLDYFGFVDDHLRHVGGVWYMKTNSYCQPDIAKMKSVAAARAAEFKRQGGRLEDIVFAELTDEPTGQPLDLIVGDEAYRTAFCAWLKAKGLTPQELLVADWNAVRMVTEAQRDSFPALYYFSQRFRTRALGDFMALQRQILEAAYGGTLPTLANFSDGAVFAGNFYAQGVDYFELLDAPDQNAIWGEDWANLSSTYQCGAYNIDLMRGAARERGQIIGHHLVSHAGRKGWDIKLKATSEVARGVKILNSFCYGPSWATHEGGPYWRSHVWYARPQTWTANASITREIGAVEDLLMKAMPAPARVAILYSSSSDIWSINRNLAGGFDRMHTWLALAHAQVPVDMISEEQAARGRLDGYQVCYLSGANLTRAAAAKLKEWVVQKKGTLWLTAGGASRDEYNRPLNVLEELLPADRGECRDLAPHTGPGRSIRQLASKDQVRWGDSSAEVLSVKQTFTPRPGAEIVAAFQDGSPAVLQAPAGNGRIYCVGFFPGLSYIKVAQEARFALEEKGKANPGGLTPDETLLLERSANPWAYPSAIRDFILLPVRAAGVAAPVQCGVPLVDAVYMVHEKGILIPLANYSNRTIESLKLRIAVPRPVVKAESARLGRVDFKASGQNVELSLPLDNNDFLKLYYE